MTIQILLTPINQHDTENSSPCCLQSHANRDYGCNVKMSINVVTGKGMIPHMFYVNSQSLSRCLCLCCIKSYLI